MNVLKKIFWVLLSLVFIGLFTALFVQKEMKSEREIMINLPRHQVFNYVKYLKNQDNYSKWATMDPAMKKSYRGTDGTVGFVSAWDSEKSDVGKGEQEIISIKEDVQIDFELRFIEPFESKATSTMYVDSTGPSSTRVRWNFSGKMNYPFNLMRLFVNMEKSIGDDFATGLERLKLILEK